MRQLFFAIVLVAAAFGGGAMVNGPAFRWVQDHVFDYMGLKDGGEIALVDLPPAPGDANADATAGSSDKKAEPIAVDRGSRKTDPKRKSLPQVFGGTKPEPKPPEPVASSEPTPAPVPAPTPVPTPPPLAGPAGAPGPEPSAPPAPLDPGVAPAILASLSPAPATLASATAPAAATAPPPIPTSDAAASGGGDWAELRRKLKAQGVTRYTIEGETGGRVVFSCLIPLAGKQAVSQRFEAEGDDEFAAAQAALRRINLWRATRTAAPASS